MQSTRLSSFIAAGVLSSLATLLSAGGLERNCNNGALPSIQERWPNATTTPFFVCTRAGTGDRALPGYPDVSCAPAGTPLAANPGFQSLERARSAINNLQLSTDPCLGINTVAASTLFIPPIQQQSQVLLPTQFPAVTNGDGLNQVSCFANFAPFGGIVTLSNTTVLFAPTTGFPIAEADIQINTRAAPNNQLVLSWYENNSLYGKELTSSVFGAASTPSYAFVDLEGLFAHELMFATGFGVSLIDTLATTKESRFPTMFDQMQVESFTDIGSIEDFHFAPSGCGLVKFPVASSSTQMKGLLGYSARTLEQDDIEAISSGYPPVATTNTGIVTGTVSVNGVGFRGAVVVAVNQACPDIGRYQTLSYDNGVYQFLRLAPGNYYVYVEPVDILNYSGGTYFQPASVPSYVVPNNSPFPGGCVLSQYVNFPREFYDTNESGAEALHNRATALSVGANTTTSGVNLQLEAGANLWLDGIAGPTGTASRRGLRVTQTALGTVQLTATDFGSPAGTQVTLYFGLAHRCRMASGQLIEVATNPADSGFLTAVTGTSTAYSIGSRFTTTIATPPGLLSAIQLHDNVYVQAVFVSGTNTRVTNPINVWVDRP